MHYQEAQRRGLVDMNTLAAHFTVSRDFFQKRIARFKASGENGGRMPGAQRVGARWAFDIDEVAAYLNAEGDQPSRRSAA